MKRLFFAIIGAALLFSACSKEKSSLPILEQNPYRQIIEYAPASYTVEVPGQVTPDADYSWISVSQTGNNAVFTVRRNTWDAIRRAEFTIKGCKDKVVFSQKGHKLDASLDASLASQTASSAGIDVIMGSDFADDYAGWGLIYGTSSDPEQGTVVAQSGAPVVGANSGTVSGLKSGVDYFIWAYAESTEGNRVLSNMVALLPPVTVKAGEDLQAAIDGAKEYATIMVQGGVTFPGGINIFGKNVNKTISGGWNADFSAQSMDNLTVIDGGGKLMGFRCTQDDNDMPLQGAITIKYFEIINCVGEHGSAIHACGGPVTVTNCYVHDNESVKGAIGTREETYSTDITVVNCILSGNSASGHGPALGFGDGKSYDDQVKATIVSNLIVGNVSTKFDGYASTFICYNNTELIFVNNTVVDNCNYEEYGGEYPGMVLRGNVRSLFANNIMVGNKTSKNTKPADYHAMNQFLGMGGGCGTVAYNAYEGAVRDSHNAVVRDNIVIASGADHSNIVTADYKPTGLSLGAGYLGKVDYREARDTENKTCDLKSLLAKYKFDLAGNPRTSNGKVDLGCYQVSK